MCGSGSPMCRIRCLKCCGSFLFIVGVIFVGGGIVFALSESKFEPFDIFDFLIVLNYSYISIWGGIGALVAGFSALYVGFTMRDDDWSPRGMAIMCILSIASTAGTMAVLTWNLYESNYFGNFNDADVQDKLEFYAGENGGFAITYEKWLATIIIYGAMCFLAIVSWAASVSAIGIGCCCPDHSEYVDKA